MLSGGGLDTGLMLSVLLQKSDGHSCPYCRCDIRGTESVLIEPYLPEGGGGIEEPEDEDEDEEDHEDVEQVMKNLAFMKKVCLTFVNIPLPPPQKTKKQSRHTFSWHKIHKTVHQR